MFATQSSARRQMAPEGISPRRVVDVSLEDYGAISLGGLRPGHAIWHAQGGASLRFTTQRLVDAFDNPKVFIDQGRVVNITIRFMEPRIGRHGKPYLSVSIAEHDFPVQIRSDKLGSTGAVAFLEDAHWIIRKTLESNSPVMNPEGGCYATLHLRYRGKMRPSYSMEDRSIFDYRPATRLDGLIFLVPKNVLEMFPNRSE